MYAIVNVGEHCFTCKHMVPSTADCESRTALQEIHNMLKENNKVLKCSNASPDWRGYVDFVNNVVVDGLSRVICASLEYLLDQVCTHLFR